MVRLLFSLGRSAAHPSIAGAFAVETHKRRQTILAILHQCETMGPYAFIARLEIGSHIIGHDFDTLTVPSSIPNRQVKHV